MDELDAWNRWWRRRGEPGLRALLTTLWDPIGVAGVPEAKDEYDSYGGEKSPLRDCRSAGVSALLSQS